MSPTATATGACTSSIPPARLYLGAQSGLGYIIVHARQFAYLDRMSLVAIIFIVATSISYRAAGALTAWMLEWAPESQRG